mmetsp:Transcript_18662/g.38826  ORF Transcript_18662/g.38826 Transcript_18662/m.38826 type:complete len:144 (-) Transcript_18662:350-781(-)
MTLLSGPNVDFGFADNYGYSMKDRNSAAACHYTGMPVNPEHAKQSADNPGSAVDMHVNPLCEKTCDDAASEACADFGLHVDYCTGRSTAMSLPRPAPISACTWTLHAKTSDGGAASAACADPGLHVDLSHTKKSEAVAAACPR